MAVNGAHPCRSLIRMRSEVRFFLAPPPLTCSSGPEPWRGRTGGTARPTGSVAAVTEVVITGLDDAATKPVVEWWTPKRGQRRVERD